MEIDTSSNKIRNLIFSQLPPTDGENLYKEIRHLLAHSFGLSLSQIESEACNPVDAMNNFWQDITGEDLTKKVDSREIFQQLQKSNYDSLENTPIHSLLVKDSLNIHRTIQNYGKATNEKT